MHDDHDHHGGAAPAEPGAEAILGRPPRIYFCYESIYRIYVDRVTSWPSTNLGAQESERRDRLDPRTDSSAGLRDALASCIAAADVVICVIAQSTFLDEWIEWELIQAIRRSPRPGLVGILTQEHLRKPKPMTDVGAIFVPFRKDMLERAVAWSLSERHTAGDFTLHED